MKRKAILIITLTVTLLYGIIIFVNPFEKRGFDIELTKVDEFKDKDELGNITRRYIFSVTDTVWTDMVKHGKSQLYSPFGSTYVFYFLTTAEIPDEVYPTAPIFNKNLHSNCVAVFKRDLGNKESFAKFPFGKIAAP